MIDTLEKNQKHIPDYGYTSPKKKQRKNVIILHLWINIFIE